MLQLSCFRNFDQGNYSDTLGNMCREMLEADILYPTYDCAQEDIADDEEPVCPSNSHHLCKVIFHGILKVCHEREMV